MSAHCSRASRSGIADGLYSRKKIRQCRNIGLAAGVVLLPACVQASKGLQHMLKEWLGMAEGILQDLHQDHEEVSSRLERLQRTEGSAERTSLFKELASMLLAHAHAEQNVLYKKMEKSDDEKVRSFALEGTNEHQIVEQQLQQMMRARNKASEQWTAQLNVLRELVNHHVKEEESTGFTCARREFDSEELEKMSGQFRRQKEKLMAEA
jgi:hemerythrin-like domain-containing protein